MDKANTNTQSTFNSKPVQEYLTKLKKWQKDINKVNYQLSFDAKHVSENCSMSSKTPSTTSSAPSIIDPMFDNISESIKFKEIGNKHFQQQKFKDAVEYYTLAIDLDPSSAILFANRAIAYIKLKNYQQAEADCNRSINLDSTYLKAYHRRGLALKEQKRYREALNDFGVVIKKDPTNKEAQIEIKELTDLIKQQPQQQSQSQPQPSSTQQQQKQQESQSLAQGETSQKMVIDIKQQQQQQQQPQQPQQQSQSQQSSLNVNSNNNSSKPTQSSSTSPKIQMIVEEDNTKQQQQQTSHQQTTQSTLKKPTTSNDSLQDRLSRLANMKPVVPKQPPRNSFEFEKVYNSLQSDSQLFYQYFKLIDPSKLSQLLNDVLTPTLVTSIIGILEHHYLVNKEYELIYNILDQLTKMNRASINIQFLTSSEKQSLIKIMNELSSSNIRDQECLNKLKSSLIK